MLYFHNTKAENYSLAHGGEVIKCSEVYISLDSFNAYILKVRLILQMYYAGNLCIYILS